MEENHVDEYRWVELKPAEGGLEITLNTVPDKEGEIAMLWDGAEQWGEINQHNGNLTLVIYPRRNGEPWEMSLDDALNLLKQAASNLLGES